MRRTIDKIVYKKSKKLDMFSPNFLLFLSEKELTSRHPPHARGAVSFHPPDRKNAPPMIKGMKPARASPIQKPKQSRCSAKPSSAASPMRLITPLMMAIARFSPERPEPLIREIAALRVAEP